MISSKYKDFLIFFSFLAFLLYYYYITISSEPIHFFDINKLIDYYKSINFNNSNDKKLFSYFLLSFLCLLFLSIFKVNEERNICFRKINFYGIFFFYYFCQIFFQILGVEIIQHFFHNSIFTLKLVIILSSFIMSPLIVLFFLFRNFYFIQFFLNFLYSLKKEWIVFFSVFLLVLFFFFLSITLNNFFPQMSLLVVYVKYSTFHEMILLFLGVVILVPLVEELIFRKYLIDYLRGFMNNGWSLFFSSVIFSIVHFDNIVASLFIFFVGLFLSFLYLWKKNLYLNYFFHLCFNLFSLIYWVFHGSID